MDAKSPASISQVDPGTSPIVDPPYPLLKNIEFFLRTWMIKTIVYLSLKFSRIFQASTHRAIAPTYTKRYPIRPTLESRVFLPKNYISGTKLPLFIDIHGGGFVLCDPADDDHFCHPFANRFGYCVVSIDYRKAPSYPFPIPVHDCAELARAVLADPDLPIDHDKVILGGFSAGGNLALAIAQLKDLRGRFKALVPVYPATDLSRRYRGEYKPNKDGKEDVLKRISQTFNWAYVNPGTDRRDPLLSCIYATKEQLPQKMFFVGAEDDVLCREAHILAKNLAGVDINSDPGPAWNENGIRWEQVPNRQHGFTHMELKGDEEMERKRVCDELYARIDSWIKQEVFKS